MTWILKMGFSLVEDAVCEIVASSPACAEMWDVSRLGDLPCALQQKKANTLID